MKLTDFSVLTFDCYGTLIDWETGLYEALQPLLQKGTVNLRRDAVLATFAKHETALQAATPRMIYSDLLCEVHRHLAREWGITVPDDHHRRFGMSVQDWPAFHDSRAALQYLKQHYKLVILSNVDHASFAGSQIKLGASFDAVYTAQDIGSYKPDPRNFQYLIARLAEQGISKTQVLHTAQSLFHDHAPANAAGLASAWIDRGHGEEGGGATVAPLSIPTFNFRFPSLAAMAEAHQQERPR